MPLLFTNRWHMCAAGFYHSQGGGTHMLLHQAQYKSGIKRQPLIAQNLVTQETANSKQRAEAEPPGKKTTWVNRTTEQAQLASCSATADLSSSPDFTITPSCNSTAVSETANPHHSFLKLEAFIIYTRAVTGQLPTTNHHFWGTEQGYPNSPPRLKHTRHSASKAAMFICVFLLGHLCILVPTPAEPTWKLDTNTPWIYLAL